MVPFLKIPKRYVGHHWTDLQWEINCNFFEYIVGNRIESLWKSSMRIVLILPPFSPARQTNSCSNNNSISIGANIKLPQILNLILWILICSLQQHKFSTFYRIGHRYCAALSLSLPSNKFICIIKMHTGEKQRTYNQRAQRCCVCKQKVLHWNFSTEEFPQIEFASCGKHSLNGGKRTRLYAIQ